jgi:hypothetical protein
MIKYCPNCQAENTEDSRFCARCGTPLEVPAAWGRSVPGEDAANTAIFAPTARSGDAPGPISGAPVAPPAWAPPTATWSAQPSYPPALPATASLAPANQGPRPAQPPARKLNWWIIGAVAAGAGFFLLALGALAAVTLVRQSPAVSRSTAPAVGGSLDAQIRAAVEASNNAQIEALRTLDPKVLDNAVIGKARSDNLAMIAALQQQGVYAEATLNHIEYRAARAQDADHATIRTVESWTTTYYRRSDKRAVNRRTSTGLDEIYYLVRQDGKWIVEQIDIRDANATPGTDDTQ